MDTVTLRKWLKSGFVYNGKLFATEAGTPQGGIISPTIANMTLDGMETMLKKLFSPIHNKQKDKNKVNLIRYADDFAITGTSKEVLEEAKASIGDFLRDRGLFLSEEKTKIVHIEEGFDFLGWNMRKYGGKFLIKPAKKNVQAFLRKVRAIIRDTRTEKQEVVIRRLNPVIRGWANYHRNQVSKETFNKVDHLIWKQLWQWARRRHPNKSRTWVKRRKHPGETAGVFELILGGAPLGSQFVCRRVSAGGRWPMRPDQSLGPPPSSRGVVRRAGSVACRQSGQAHRPARPVDRRC